MLKCHISIEFLPQSKGSSYLRDESGDADTKVNIETIADLLSRAPGDTMPPIFRLVRLARLSLLARCQFRHLNRFRVGRLNDTINVYTGDVDRVRGEGPNGTGAK